MYANSRRQFLGGTVAAAASAALARSVFGAAENRTLRLGLIGAGWCGMTDVQAALQAGGVEFAALCDVDSGRLKQMPTSWKGGKASGRRRASCTRNCWTSKGSTR